jgi:beta-fructofuranosidase
VVELAADGTPRLLPAVELLALRTGSGRRADARLAAGDQTMLEADAGRALDVEARLVPGIGGRVWLRVLASQDGAEVTEVGVDDAGRVYLSRDRSSRRPGTLGGTFWMPVGLDEDGGVELRVLVDGSVVEVFAGEGHALTARAYPESLHSTGLVAGADQAAGSAEVRWWPVRTEDWSPASVS